MPLPPRVSRGKSVEFHRTPSGHDINLGRFRIGEITGNSTELPLLRFSRPDASFVKSSWNLERLLPCFAVEMVMRLSEF
jgi:hypothetical protein